MSRQFARQFYKSKDWQSARTAALIRDKGMCQTAGCYNPAEEVHHIKPLTPENINDAAVALNLDNLVSLCRDCHMKIHEKERILACQHNDILPDIVFDGARPAPRLKK